MPLNSQAHTTKKRALGLILAGWLMLLLAVLALVTTQNVRAAGDEPPGEPESDPASIDSRLAKPVLPDQPNMADHGAVKYWGVCLACHGDVGQGLTDEWREAGFGEDMNCWQSKCHSPNHPPQGFEIPRYAPAIVGPGTLQRFTTANELRDYLYEKMPWWDPGALTEDESWNLTAFLLRENGVLPKETRFNIAEAALSPVHVPIRDAQASERAGGLTLAALLGLAVLVTVAGSRFSNDTPIPGTRPSFFDHLHPPSIPLQQARWRYTLGAGGLSVFLVLILLITGTLEMFFYIPTPEQAGPSIQAITFSVPFGALIRGLHFWAAQALIIVAGIHLLRVVFTGSFVPPRRFNYLLGMLLFVLLLFFNFTGYVLRWDEGIRWALLVGTNLLKTIPFVGEQLYGFVVGGSQPGPATLTRFYAWHIFGLTLVSAVLIGWHIFRVRRDGGISAPPPELRFEPRRLPRFELVRREVLAMLVALFALILIGQLIPPPLKAPIVEASASSPLLDVNAPWFFLWVQQLLRFGDAFWMGIVIPLAALAVLAAIPYIFPSIPDEQKGSWFPRAGRVAQVIVAAMSLGWLALTILELVR